MTFDRALTDLHILALTLCGMARNASIEEQIALGCKLRNRVLNGSSYRVECAKEACWHADVKAGNTEKVLALMHAVLNGSAVDLQYREAAWVAVGILNGFCRDVLNGATEGHPANEVPRPAWARSKKPHLNYARQTWYLPEGTAA